MPPFPGRECRVFNQDQDLKKLSHPNKTQRTLCLRQGSSALLFYSQKLAAKTNKMQNTQARGFHPLSTWWRGGCLESTRSTPKVRFTAAPANLWHHPLPGHFQMCSPFPASQETLDSLCLLLARAVVWHWARREWGIFLMPWVAFPERYAFPFRPRSHPQSLCFQTHIGRKELPGDGASNLFGSSAFPCEPITFV